ncbi:MAG: S8 family serine peptidase [Parafilimonas sp.]|nr:S8 family serine peptidase [Parafilimonas sp.]
MRKFYTLILLLICFCIISFNASAQQYSKYVVVFKNKNNSPYHLNKPIQYLSHKSILRRQRYNIAIDSSDLPVNPSYITQVLAQGAVSYLSQSKWLNQILIYTTSTSAVNAIKQLSFVQSVNPVGPASTTGKPLINKFNEKVEPFNSIALKSAGVKSNHYLYGNSYDQIHIHDGEFLHNKGFTGAEMTIAIIDAGFYHYKTTTAFDSTRKHNRFLGEKDFVDFDNSVNEDYDHGELCLSTIASNVPGVMVGTAPDASFWLLRSENANSEYPIEEHNWAAAAEFADSVGVDMISSSLGYMQFDDPQFNHTYNDFYKNTTMVSRAATFAAKKGILVTNSAGNEGGSSWNYIIFPADDDSICAVAATDVNGKIASFSSYGYPGKVKPNISSVGLNTTLYSSSGLTSGSGTSFSNPNINGLIACLWQAFPEFNNMTILNAVYKSADRDTAPTNRYGYGISNMKKAYNILLRKRNQNLYGNEWLIASSNNFTNEISFKLIGRIDGKATVHLINANNKIAATLNLQTEADEPYDAIISDLNDFTAGKYLLQYADGTNTTSIVLIKQETASTKSKPAAISAVY